MSVDGKSDLRLEIAHVLFIDIVGYSKLLINEQGESLHELNDVVRATETFRSAEAAGKLTKIPTGDGMALVFSTALDAPVQCALEVSKALKSRPDLRVRMGVHSGPVSAVTDVNNRTNIAGGGINMAQRVMDCGDAGHILLSKRVAEDLAEYRQWQPSLHDLGECQVKHDVTVSVVNLYTDDAGNSAVPAKFANTSSVAPAVSAAKPKARSKTSLFVFSIIALLIIAGAIWFFSRQTASKSTTAAPTNSTAPPPGAATIPEKSIAVLPFENLSRDPENAFFTDGVQDEILTDLAKVADLKVISRTSVMQYKSGTARNLREIAQQLGVAHLLEGSVQRAGGKVRVNAQLIDARSDAHQWAQSFDRDIADVFAIQSEIAKAIADQLQAKLSPSEKTAIERPPTSDVTAFDLYSRAKNLLLTTSFSAQAKSNLLQAVDLLNQAVARDPQFFLAYCQLAYGHSNLYFLGLDHTPERSAQTEAAVAAAFRLRPDAGEAHLARAEKFYRVDLDYSSALKELETARQTLPNDPHVFELTGYIRRRQGQQNEGLRHLQHALELDPRNFFTLQQIALSYQMLRRYPEEVPLLDRALAINPGDTDTKVGRAVVDLDWKADPRPLHQTIESLRAQNADAVRSVADSWLICALAERDGRAAESAVIALGENVFTNDAVALDRDFCQGLIARMTNDQSKARAAFSAARARQEKIAQAQPDYGPALCVLGLIDAGLGKKEEALREGRRAIELLPVAKDAINGAHMIEYFAVISAWVGEKDLACDQLAIVTEIPGTLSYGQLKLEPYWDPLRGHPRFEKIVASLVPK
jgi:TolB-like protein/class 3 adenylate cyclase